jgi:myosin heavy subunit
VQNPKPNAEEVYVLGSVTDAAAADGSVAVKLDGGASGAAELNAHTADIFQANPDGLVCPDNTMLIHLSEPTLLANVRARFAAKEIYTLTGSILLAMNPFEMLPIYSEARMADYKGKALGRAPPHVYGIAEVAYQMLVKSGRSQSVVVSGESGAGKVRTARARAHRAAHARCSHARPAVYAARVPRRPPRPPASAARLGRPRGTRGARAG